MKITFYSHANKTHLHSKGFALSPVFKVRVSGSGNGLFTMPRNLHSKCALIGASGMSHTCHEYTQTDSSEHPHQSYHWQKIRFLKEEKQFSTNGKLVLSRLVCHHFCSLAAQAVSRNGQWRGVRLHLITGTPNDFIPRHSWIRIIVKVAWDMQNPSYVFQRLFPVHILLLRYRENCHKKVFGKFRYNKTSLSYSSDYVLKLSRPYPLG